MARPIAHGELVALWRPRADERREFLRAVRDSEEVLGDWVHPPRDHSGYAEFLRRARARDRVTFVARRLDDRRLVGVVNVNNISMGAFCSATLGYYGFVGGSGDGRMTEAVGLAVDQCFTTLGLHRVEANVQPGNDRSIALVARLGFRFEGFSPRMLLIGGSWRDHNRYALTIDDWAPSR